MRLGLLGLFTVVGTITADAVAVAAGVVLASSSSPPADGTTVATLIAAVANLGAVGVLGYGTKKLLNGELVNRDLAAADAAGQAALAKVAELAANNAELARDAHQRETAYRDALAEAVRNRGGRT